MLGLFFFFFADAHQKKNNWTISVSLLCFTQGTGWILGEAVGLWGTHSGQHILTVSE